MDGRALVATNLRRIRVAKGISQERLAFDANVDRSYYGGIERQSEYPSLDLLDKLAVTLEVALAELFVLPSSPGLKELKRGRRPKS